MSTTRIYAVTCGNRTELVEATSQAAAIRHLAKDVYRAHIPSTKEIAGLMARGHTVAKATNDHTVETKGEKHVN